MSGFQRYLFREKFFSEGYEKPKFVTNLISLSLIFFFFYSGISEWCFFPLQSRICISGKYHLNLPDCNMQNHPDKVKPLLYNTPIYNYLPISSTLHVIVQHQHSQWCWKKGLKRIELCLKSKVKPNMGLENCDTPKKKIIWAGMLEYNLTCRSTICLFCDLLNCN